MANARILVADDHAETRALIASLLKSEFDVVATVADGQAAVEATAALQPDVVVLDIAMPVLNGFEAAAIIRDLPDAPGSYSAPPTMMWNSPKPPSRMAPPRWC